MNTVVKIFRAMRLANPTDAEFENYYGQLMRDNTVGGPSAAEARRDFAVVRQSLDRVQLF